MNTVSTDLAQNENLSAHDNLEFMSCCGELTGLRVGTSICLPCPVHLPKQHTVSYGNDILVYSSTVNKSFTEPLESMQWLEYQSHLTHEAVPTS
jgi:hypothetical protein